MSEEFTIDISYKGQPVQLPAVFSQFGYSYRINVLIDNEEVIYEPDEERKFRALLADNISGHFSQRTVDVIRLAGDYLNAVFKDT